MEKNVFDVVGNTIRYFANVRLGDLMRILFYIGISAGIGYCAALITIGFPCTFYEEITKKKINDEIESNITLIVAMCLGFAFFYFAWIV